MTDILQALRSTTVRLLVDTELRDGGFAITYPGLLGKTVVTSPAITQAILDSPEFDQLFQGAKAARILDIVLAQAQH
ncbi:hypothetical protein [Hymenobacter bucti]|uniref:Uncharacterized protein n=1 Tax=Hymenobacter bucti TaxID=1844114 RepID=A0ABW4QRA2_9BACT